MKKKESNRQALSLIVYIKNDPFRDKILSNEESKNQTSPISCSIGWYIICSHYDYRLSKAILVNILWVLCCRYFCNTSNTVNHKCFENKYALPNEFTISESDNHLLVNCHGLVMFEFKGAR
jgi:hypothetical protein